MLFHDLAVFNSVELQLSPVKEHDVNRVGEQYHAPLQRIHLVLQCSHIIPIHQMTLLRVLKGINDTDGPEGLAFLTFAFEVLQSLSERNRLLPAQKY